MKDVKDFEATRGESSITHHSSLISHHLSPITHHSSLITRHLSSITHHSSLITHHFPFIILAVALAAVGVGCGTIYEARVAQYTVAAKAIGVIEEEKEYPEVGATLEEMVQFALGNRPVMVSAKLSVEDARLALKELSASAPLASATPWNAIGASANVGYSEQSKSKHHDDLRSKTYGNASGGLSVDVLLWDFGRNDANVRAQAERVVAAELDLIDAGYTVFDEVATAYFQRLQSAALLEVAFTNEQMRAEHLFQSEERLAAGEAQKLDVLRAKLDLAEAREAIVAASNNYVNASAELAAALGLEADWGRELDIGDANISGYVQAFDTTADTSSQLFDFARTNAPAVQVARAKLRAASHAVDYAIADLMPNVSASFSLNWTDPLWYWRWGFNAVQNLFSGFRDTTAVDRAVVAMDLAAANVDKAELALSLSIELATEERDNAREAFATAQASVRSAKENLDTVREQFSVGDVSRVEFTDAVADYSSALANREKAFYRGQIAEAKLFAVTGVRPAYSEKVIGVEE